MDNIKVCANNILRTICSMNMDNLKIIKKKGKENLGLVSSFKVKARYFADITVSLINTNEPEKLFFSVIEYIILTICFDYYIRNFTHLDEQGYLQIKVKTIHEVYRKMSKKIKIETLLFYEQAFKNLSCKYIDIDFDDYECRNTYISKCNIYKISQPLLKYQVVKEKDKIVAFKFSLGLLGVLLKNSKQIFTIPTNFLELKENYIDTLVVAEELGYLIYLNSKKERFDISFNALLNRLLYFDRTSKIALHNYMEILLNKNKNFYKDLDKIKSLVVRILKKYEKDGYISEFVCPIISTKNFEDYDIKYTIHFGN